MGRSRISTLSSAAIALGAATVLALGACTAAPEPTASSAPPAAEAPGTGILPGYQDETTLQFSPLIIGVLNPDVVPVRGSDGVYYVAYELTILNDAPRDATMTAIETIADDEHGAVVSIADQAQIAANTLLAGGTPTGTAEIPVGRTAIVVVRAGYPSLEAIPATFTHRVIATFAPPTPDGPRLASMYPDEVAQIGGFVTTSTETPLAIGAPVAGDGWFANNSLESAALNAHSDVIIPVGGRITGAERYAIDFLRIDVATMTSTDGDPALNESYLAFDQPLLAVADATVVRVVSTLPDVTPRQIGTIDVVDEATGNHVVLDLGGGVFAMYAHMKQGSATVAVGDTVVMGQEIGRLGNSGNTSEAHLHFQLQRGPLLSAESVPFVIERFTATGILDATGDSVVPPPLPGERTNEFPVMNTISRFPDQRM